MPLISASMLSSLPFARLLAVGSVANQVWGWGNDHDSWGWGGWLVMMGFMALFWIIVAVLIIWAVRSFSGGQTGGGPGRREQPRLPMDIARERYARGEISDEEFERIKRGLSS